MHLFVIRHAIAVPRSDEIADSARPLTEQGRKRFSRVVRGLSALDVRFERLVYSPWLRAMQTAEMLSTLVDHDSAVSQHLASPPTQELLADLHGERVAVVGHEPWLGELIAWLAFGNPELGAQLELRKGGVVWLEGEPQPGNMTLRAALTPKILRRCRG
jgi:phosphohistidine phosphatase